MVIIFYLHRTKITKRADTSHEVSALILIRHNSLPDSNIKYYKLLFYIKVILGNRF